MSTFFESELFNINAKGTRLVTSASDIDFEPDQFICIAIGPSDVTFEHFETHRDQDNDITHWTYVIKSGQKFNGEVTAKKVVIFND